MKTHLDSSRYVVLNVKFKREQFICLFVYKYLLSTSPHDLDLFKSYYFLIEIYLIYSVMLVLGVAQWFKYFFSVFFSL